MSKRYVDMTPREHIIETVVGRIKCGRVNDIHAAIEGLAEEGTKAPTVGHLSVAAKIHRWYEDSTYAQRERLIRAIEKRVQ